MYKIVKSKRKTIQIEVTKNCEVVVKAPLFVTDLEIDRFVTSKEAWISEAQRRIKLRERIKKESGESQLYAKDIRELTLKARAVIPAKVRLYAEKMNVTYGKISIKTQKSRWGSCSAKGNLNFNCLLMLAPDEVVDYVVVHELSHRVYMNHSKDFWRQVATVIPAYRKSERWLKENGVRLMERVHEREDE